MSLEDDKIYGLSVEKYFELCFIEKFIIEEASKYDNMVNHIDFWLTNRKTNKTIGVDVKGKKRIIKSGELSEDSTWIEFKNIIGKDGWIKGKADYIAFFVKDRFLLVERLALFNVVDIIVKFNKNKKGRGYYELHDRKKYGKDDLMTLIPLSLIYKIGGKEIYYEK